MRIRLLLPLLLAAVAAGGPLAPARALPVNPSPLPGRVVVAAHHGRFLAWPANNGFWSWDDGRELLVGFSDGPWQRRPEGHQVGQPQVLRLARSLDGGHSWRVETPPEGLNRIGEPQIPAAGAINFAAPDLAVRVVAGGGKGSLGRLGAFHVSQDRGRSWRGPFAFRGLEDDPRLVGLRFSSRTSVLPLGPQSALFLLSVQDPSLPRWSGRLDKSLAVRSDDGGRTFRMLGWLVPWRDPYRAVMPSAVVLGPDQLVAALRRRDPFGGDSDNWIDLVASSDGGRHWQLRSRVGESGCCNGNPPALTRLRDGRLACAWANRSRRQLLLRLSSDQGRSWGPELVLRSNPDNHDMGYPQMHENDRGELVVLYYLATPERPHAFIEATLLPVPATAAPAPGAAAAAAPVLGRWQASSTAGAAVLDVVTVTPERVRWGTPYNGRCDSAYSLSLLPDGHGTYPDNLIAPAEPHDPVYRVVRLTLQPGPCRSGDAVLQLAVPLDAPDRAFATTYATGGRLTGWYGELEKLPDRGEPPQP